MDEWLIVILTVVGQASLAGLTLQAIAEENSYQLLASTFLSVLVALLWTICMVSQQQQRDRARCPGARAFAARSNISPLNVSACAPACAMLRACCVLKAGRPGNTCTAVLSS